MSSKSVKKSVNSRLSPGNLKDTASVSAIVLADGKKGAKFSIWPEFTESDINAEKWDLGFKVKDKDKRKSPVTHYFDDPEGKIEIPPSLKVESWKRPQEFILGITPTVVDAESLDYFDLISSNEHLFEDELMRHIMSQVTVLWKMSVIKDPPSMDLLDPTTVFQYTHSWRPWEHIYSLCKVSKGPHIPQYNSCGKYVVRLYWMGCWRKIIIDDSFPFNKDNQLLLPSTTLKHELWPLLLTKAIVKVASLGYNRAGSSEFGDCSVLHCLTGWLPEAVPILSTNVNDIWELLLASLPSWTWPTPEVEKLDKLSSDEVKKDEIMDTAKEERSEIEASRHRESKVFESKSGKEMGKEKLGKDTKESQRKTSQKSGKDMNKKSTARSSKASKKDKGRDKEKSPDEEFVVPEKPEMAIFAAYWMHRYPVKVSLLGRMSDASERLRQIGLSHTHTHPVWITQTRLLPLEPPPEPEQIPAWKLIRPQKKKIMPTAEPKEPEVFVPIQCLEICTPLMNCVLSPIPIPTETHRSKSVLERGGTRSCPSTSTCIEETDEQGPFDEDDEEKQSVAVEEKAELVSDELLPPSPVSKLELPNISLKTLGKEGKLSGSKNKATKKSKDLSVKENTQQEKRSMSKSKRKSASLRNENIIPDIKEEESKDLKDEMMHEEVKQSEAEDKLEYSTEKIKQVKTAWIDFKDFCRSFKTLYIYHKPNTYAYNIKFSDIKTGATPSTGRGEKRLSISAINASSLDKQYLFVDNLNPTKIVICFSTLVCWQSLDKDKESVPSGYNQALEGMHVHDFIHQRTLAVEPCYWKSLAIANPILIIRTTATRAAVLNLPAGRHVLQFVINSPLGYSIHMSSTVPFVFGDEEMIMVQSAKESCQFVSNATQVILAIGKCIKSFSDAKMLSVAWKELISQHCPYYEDCTISKRHHFELFNEALYQSLTKPLETVISPKVTFAWRAFTFDVTTKQLFSLQKEASRPRAFFCDQIFAGFDTWSKQNSDFGGLIAFCSFMESLVDLHKITISATSVRSSSKIAHKKLNALQDSSVTGVESEKSEAFKTFIDIMEENHVFAVKIQKVWRGYWLRKIRNARIPGTAENAKVAEQLQKCWQLMEPHAEQIGLTLFRNMFKADPDIMVWYKFYQDEWSKICYSDYTGAYLDQFPNTWFVIFRDVFYVSEEMLMVPKLLISNLKTCFLRVINNDNGEEIEMVFNKVAPHFYKKNERGYTFMAEVRTEDTLVLPGKWKMRLIGSFRNLPAPLKNEVNCNFITQEFQEYYVPHKKNIVFRYRVKVIEDHLASIQMSTSKPDVYIKLMVLNNEEEVYSTKGKGHAVLPAVIFQKNIILSDQNQSLGLSESGKMKVTISEPVWDAGKNDLPHKYIIQAVVENSSWPLKKRDWVHILRLMEIEKDDLKVNNRDPAPIPVKSQKSSQSLKPKSVQNKGGKETKPVRSLPPSPIIDVTKPHWILRVVSDAHCIENIEIYKDTERLDQIRAQKRSWEDADPGRSARALQSRLKFLNSHSAAKQDFDDEEMLGVQITDEDKTDDEDNVVLTLEPPESLLPKEVLQPLDTTPFVRIAKKKPDFMDEKKQQQQLLARQEEIQSYFAQRQQVEKWWFEEKQYRNLTKQNQLDDCQQLQYALDIAREAVNTQRETFRQKILEAKRKQEEELAAIEAAIKAEQDAKDPKKKKSAKDKKKK